MKRRVVITGMGLLSPIGNTVDSAMASLKAGRSGVRRMPNLGPVKGLLSQVGATVADFGENLIPRKFRRSMGRLALLAAAAGQQAVTAARLDTDLIRSGRVGVCIGQTTGSASATEQYLDALKREGVRGLKCTWFLQMMSHSAAANLAQMLGVAGRVWAPAASCASGSLAIGQGFEAIRDGHQDVMLCGGTEELHVATNAAFDVVGAASRAFNDRPTLTPRPFDVRRDGLVMAEGAGIVVLEEYEHAKRRSAAVLGEVLGFATYWDCEHLWAPAREGMARTIAGCLQSAECAANDVEYVNAHAAGTPTGDPAEAQATRSLVGHGPLVSSTKGHTGHTGAACGALEAIFCIEMIRQGFLVPTLNLEEVAPECAGLRYLREFAERKVSRVLTNNFALGGVSTSLLLGAAS